MPAPGTGTLGTEVGGWGEACTCTYRWGWEEGPGPLVAPGREAGRAGRTWVVNNPGGGGWQAPEC